MTDQTPSPMPGTPLDGGIVVASVLFREADDEIPDDLETVLVLYPEQPFFGVGVVWTRDGYPWEVDEYPHRHLNIVPAVREYEQTGGDY